MFIHLVPLIAGWPLPDDQNVNLDNDDQEDIGFGMRTWVSIHIKDEEN